MPSRGPDGRFAGPDDDTFVRVTNADIYRKLEEMSAKLDPLPSMVADHERRLRTVEKGFSKLVGAVSLVTPTVAVVSGLIASYYYTR